MSGPEAARVNMVESQLKTNRLTDPAAIEAFLTVPRERFVPENLRGLAYLDEDLPLGGGRFLMEPMVFGRMVQEAALSRGDSVLEIGSATGYGVAVLARLAGNVVGVESDPALARKAGETLASLGIANASVLHGPLERGWPERAPYDVILFAGAVAEVPPAVLEQLGEGGRLLAVVRGGDAIGRMTLYHRVRGIVSGVAVFDAATRYLPGLAPQPSFVF
jgi:protein-L-isoaspartate(D-aspartate) O-methyltransferase